MNNYSQTFLDLKKRSINLTCTLSPNIPLFFEWVLKKFTPELPIYNIEWVSGCFIFSCLKYHEASLQGFYYNFKLDPLLRLNFTFYTIHSLLSGLEIWNFSSDFPSFIYQGFFPKFCFYPHTQNLALKFQEKMRYGQCLNRTAYWDKYELKCTIDGKLFSPFVFIGDFTVIDIDLLYNIPFYVIKHQIPNNVYQLPITARLNISQTRCKPVYIDVCSFIYGITKLHEFYLNYVSQYSGTKFTVISSQKKNLFGNVY